MVKVAVNGALGRMGMRILNLASRSKDFKIIQAFDLDTHSFLGKDIGILLGFEKALGVEVENLHEKGTKFRRLLCDVLIDFSGPDGANWCVNAALASKKALVIGSTGLDQQAVEKIKTASTKIPILFSPNMSVGANFIFEIARLAAAKLKSGYDIEIIEAHHRSKKDAPSGTAKKIAEVIAKEKGWDLKKVARYGREGFTGERTSDELGIHVIRGGDIVGEHTVMFSGPGETVEFKHTALSRDAFARGALVAALFLSKKKNGLYNMLDVLK